MNENLATRERVKTELSFITPGREEISFIHWSEARCINHCRTDLVCRSDWPAYNELHSFCVLLLGYKLFFFFLFGPYLILFSWFVIIFDFCLFFLGGKELKIGWVGRMGELEWHRKEEEYDWNIFMFKSCFK